MALSLLAGPFDIVDGITGEPVWGFKMLMWWPGIGLMGHDAYTEAGILTLDGVFQGVSETDFTLYSRALGWWSDARKMLHVYGEYEQVVEPKTFLHMGRIPGEAVEGLSSLAYGYVKVNDARYHTSSYYVTSLVEGVTTNVSASSSPIYSMSVRGQGRNENELFIVGRDYDRDHCCCCFYDLTSNTFSSWMYPGVDTFDLYFASDFGVIVARSGEVLRIWSTEVKPFGVSIPELYKGESRGGRLATYRVRVTGDLGEACVGELIDWAHSGEGSLLKYQSETDEDGYAITRVRYGLSDSGSVEIKASLTC